MEEKIKDLKPGTAFRFDPAGEFEECIYQAGNYLYLGGLDQRHLDGESNKYVNLDTGSITDIFDIRKMGDKVVKLIRIKDFEEFT